MADRRARTRDEVVQTALDVMRERGAAGLSLGEVAKRMGLQTPSLYGYFPSKAALCDEIFARGWRDLNDAMAVPYVRLAQLLEGDDLRPLLRACLEVYVTWALENAPTAQLMFWRPIQGWEPGKKAFAPAVAALAATESSVADLQARGLLRADAEVEEMTSILTVLGSGVISQQLSNEPGVRVEAGRHSRHLTALAEMFNQRYAATQTRSGRGEKDR